MAKFLCMFILSALCSVAYSDIPVKDCTILNVENTTDDFSKISLCININIKYINKIYDYLRSNNIKLSPIHINIKIDKNGKSNLVAIEESDTNLKIISDYLKMVSFPILEKNSIYTAFFDENGKFLIEKSLLDGELYIVKPVESIYVKGDLTTDYVRKTIDQNAKEILQKYQNLLQENPQLEGAIRFRINILPNGIVKAISINEKDITISEKLAKELEIIISKFIFPKSDNGVIANYPINLYPN